MENRSYKISVIIITYNHEKYIHQAIESVLKQKVNFDYEIIIGDDASTDNTQEIIKGFQERFPDIFKAILRKENLGTTRNVYDLKLMAKGEYIAFLEGDDFWVDKNKLQKQVEFLDKNKDYIGCASKYWKVTEEGLPLKVKYASDINYNKKFTMNDFLKGKANRLFQSGSVVYRNIFLNNDQDYSIFYKAHKFIGDGTSLAILLDQGDFYIFSEQMSAYRINTRSDGKNVSQLISKNPIEYTKAVFRYADMLEDYFNQKYNFYFMRNMAMAHSLRKYRTLNIKDRIELKGIIRELKASEKLLFFIHVSTSLLRYMLYKIQKQ